MPDNTYRTPTPGPLGPSTDADVVVTGTYDGGHLIIRGNHLWVDATGDLRIKSSAPTSDTDGTVVGTQS